MEVTIKQVDNGFIITYDELNNEGVYVSKEQVFELLENQEEFSEGNCETILRMLYQVLIFFNLVGSKHDAYRVKIVVEKQ